MTTPNADGGEANKLPRVDSVDQVSSTKWLALKTYNWTDEEGNRRRWDAATRNTKIYEDKADAVVIIPVLRSQSNPQVVDTLMVEQFRPPMKQATLEFPAGLIDEGELIDNAALRELREETGYVGEKCINPPEISRPTCISPGITNESIHVVLVKSI